MKSEKINSSHSNENAPTPRESALLAELHELDACMKAVARSLSEAQGYSQRVSRILTRLTHLSDETSDTSSRRSRDSQRMELAEYLSLMSPPDKK